MLRSLRLNRILGPPANLFLSKIPVYLEGQQLFRSDGKLSRGEIPFLRRCLRYAPRQFPKGSSPPPGRCWLLPFSLGNWGSIWKIPDFLLVAHFWNRHTKPILMHAQKRKKVKTEGLQGHETALSVWDPHEGFMPYTLVQIQTASASPEGNCRLRRMVQIHPLWRVPLRWGMQAEQRLCVGSGRALGSCAPPSVLRGTQNCSKKQSLLKQVKTSLIKTHIWKNTVVSKVQWPPSARWPCSRRTLHCPDRNLHSRVRWKPRLCQPSSLGLKLTPLTRLVGPRCPSAPHPTRSALPDRLHCHRVWVAQLL